MANQERSVQVHAYLDPVTGLVRLGLGDGIYGAPTGFDNSGFVIGGPISATAPAGLSLGFWRIGVDNVGLSGRLQVNTTSRGDVVLGVGHTPAAGTRVTAIGVEAITPPSGTESEFNFALNIDFTQTNNASSAYGSHAININGLVRNLDTREYAGIFSSIAAVNGSSATNAAYCYDSNIGVAVGEDKINGFNFEGIITHSGTDIVGRKMGVLRAIAASGTVDAIIEALVTAGTWKRGFDFDAVGFSEATLYAPTKIQLFDVLSLHLKTGDLAVRGDLAVKSLFRHVNAANSLEYFKLAVDASANYSFGSSSSAPLGVLDLVNAGLITLRLQGVASQVNAVQVSAAATGNAVKVSAIGTDTDIPLDLIPQGAGVLRYKGNTLVAQVLSQGTQAGTVGIGTTTYVTFSNATFSATENQRQAPMARVGTARNLYLTTSTAQPGAGSLVVTVRKNGVDTALTLTIAAGAAAGTFSDVTHSVAFAAGDLISVKFLNNDGASVSAGVIGFAVTYDAA